MNQHIKQDVCIGTNIAKARTNQNLSQELLAARLQTAGCDITRGTIAKIEVGIRHIKISELRALSRILSVTYQFLIDGTDTSDSSGESQVVD